MKSSTELKDLATALSNAQGQLDKFTESRLIREVVRATSYKPKGKGTILSRFLEKIATGTTDCWYWVGARDEAGYGIFAHSQHLRAHRTAFHLFKGEIPLGMKVLHKCDVRCCVNPDHLFLGTQADNVRDMVLKGRARTSSRFGEDNPAAKLTKESIKAIRLERETNKTPYNKIASSYGVSAMTAYRAIKGESWKTK